MSVHDAGYRVYHSAVILCRVEPMNAYLKNFPCLWARYSSDLAHNTLVLQMIHVTNGNATATTHPYDGRTLCAYVTLWHNPDNQRPLG
jgi:hypothetical protein